MSQPFTIFSNEYQKVYFFKDISKNNHNNIAFDWQILMRINTVWALHNFQLFKQLACHEHKNLQNCYAYMIKGTFVYSLVLSFDNI